MDDDAEGKAPTTNRKRYRASKRETAVKVYTVNQESTYLLVKNVPSLGVEKDLLSLFALYGKIEQWLLLGDVESAEYTDVYWIKFQSLGDARFAKKKCDDHNFFGNLLDITYAPQYETMKETRQKLEERRRLIPRKLAHLQTEAGGLGLAFGRKRDAADTPAVGGGASGARAAAAAAIALAPTGGGAPPPRMVIDPLEMPDWIHGEEQLQLIRQQQQQQQQQQHGSLFSSQQQHPPLLPLPLAGQQQRTTTTAYEALPPPALAPGVKRKEGTNTTTTTTTSSSSSSGSGGGGGGASAVQPKELPPGEKYFGSASMNSTVLSIRQKLSKTAAPGGPAPARPAAAAPPTGNYAAVPPQQQASGGTRPVQRRRI